MAGGATGQVKCGTTDLFAKISRHPDVYQSTVKEQHFFSREWYTGDRYLDQFVSTSRAGVASLHT